MSAIAAMCHAAPETPMNPTSTIANRRALAPLLVLALSLAGTGAATCFAWQRATAQVHQRFDEAVQFERQAMWVALHQRQRLLDVIYAFCSVYEPLRPSDMELFTGQAQWRTLFPELVEIGYLAAPLEGRTTRNPIESVPPVTWQTRRDTPSGSTAGASMPGGADTRDLLQFTRDGYSAMLTGEAFTSSNGASAHLTVMAFFSTRILRTGNDLIPPHRGWFYAVSDADELTRKLPLQFSQGLVTTEIADSSANERDRQTRPLPSPSAANLFGAADMMSTTMSPMVVRSEELPAAPGDSFTRRYDYRFLGRNWTVRFQPSSVLLSASQMSSVGWVAGIGSVLSILLAAITWTQTSHRLRVEALNAGLESRIADRTAQLERAVAEEKRFAQLKTSFVSIVSHEFRTPLGNIQSSAQLLLNYFDRLTSAKREELLRSVVESTGRMAGMMEDVLLLSRVESSNFACQPEPVNLFEFCHRVVDEVGSATNQRCPVQLKLGELPADTRADATLLRHLLTNVLSNAVKYSAPGSPVELEVDCPNGRAEFTVRDRGIGIPPEDQARLFEAFRRGSNVGDAIGTGLGLVIVKRCVDLLGGDIRVESEPGRGTTVRVHLPVGKRFSPSDAPPRIAAPQTS
jgi:signal transduction histidine kinase